MGLSIPELHVMKISDANGILEGQIHFCNAADFPAELIERLYGREHVIEFVPNATLIISAPVKKNNILDNRLFGRNYAPVLVELVNLGPELLVYVSPKRGRQKSSDRMLRKWRRRFIERLGLDQDRVEFHWSNSSDDLTLLAEELNGPIN